MRFLRPVDVRRLAEEHFGRLPSASRTASGAGGSSSRRSVGVRAHLDRSTPSAISSPAPGPTMPTPRMRSVFGSSISLVMPSVRSSVIARPDAAHGNARRSTSRLLLLRLGLGQAAPGHLRIGEDHRRNRQRLERDACSPAIASTATRAFVRRLVREHRLADDVADRVDRRLGGAPRRVDLDEAARVDLRRWSCRGRAPRSSAGGRPRPARGRTSARSAVAGSFALEA